MVEFPLVWHVRTVGAVFVMKDTQNAYGVSPQKVSW